jgi:hypothetical protein
MFWCCLTSVNCRALRIFNSVVILFWSSYLQIATILMSVYSCLLLFHWTHLHGLLIFTNLQIQYRTHSLPSVTLLHHTWMLHGASRHRLIGLTRLTNSTHLYFGTIYSQIFLYLQSNLHFTFYWGAMNLYPKLRKILNGENVILRLLSWVHCDMESGSRPAFSSFTKLVLHW